MPGVGQLPIGDVMKFVDGHLKGLAGGRDAEPIAEMRTRNRSTHSDAAARADDLVHFDLGVGKRSPETIDQGFHALTTWVLTGSERNVVPILGDGFVEKLGLALERFVEGFDSGAFIRCKDQNHRLLFHLTQVCPIELSTTESSEDNTFELHPLL